jgi:hypothetical protein
MVENGFWLLSSDSFTPIDQVFASTIDSKYAYFSTRSNIVRIRLSNMTESLMDSSQQIAIGSGYQRYDVF